jgi:hypothetical protein
MSAVMPMLAVAAFFLACGVMFVRRRLRSGDEFYGTLGLTFILLAVAQAASCLTPSGDGLAWVFLIRLAAFLLLASKMMRLGLAR